jgi:hypothetical protein
MFSHVLKNNFDCLLHQCTIVSLKLAADFSCELYVSVVKVSSSGLHQHYLYTQATALHNVNILFVNAIEPGHSTSNTSQDVHEGNIPPPS